MSIKLELSMTQNSRDEKICVDYWAYDQRPSRILCNCRLD